MREWGESGRCERGVNVGGVRVGCTRVGCKSGVRCESKVRVEVLEKGERVRFESAVRVGGVNGVCESGVQEWEM